MSALNEQNLGNVQELQNQLAQLSETDLTNIGQEAAQLMAALDGGDVSAEEAEQYAEELQRILNLVNIAEGQGDANVLNGIAAGMASYDWSGDVSTMASSLQAAIATVMPQVGDDAAAGIGQGQAGHDFSGDAATTIGNDETALRNAAASHSPAARFMPLGEDISAGIGQGMSQHDFAGDAAAVIASIEACMAPDLFTGMGQQVGEVLIAGLTAVEMPGMGNAVSGNIKASVAGSLNAATLQPDGQNAARGIANGMMSYSFGTVGTSIASKIKASVSASLNTSTLNGVGTNIMQGLARGITSGAALAAAAARAAAASVVAAAKSALKIQSPSKVFEEEVGLMAMKGLGQGFLKGEKEQAKAIRNAARYLTEEAQAGVVGGSTNNDNRKTYNQQSSVHLTGNTFYIRDESDIRTLAVEIASLSNRKQRGVGARS